MKAYSCIEHQSAQTTTFENDIFRRELKGARLHLFKIRRETGRL